MPTVAEFHTAARASDIDELERLLEADPSLLNSKNDLGQSAIVLAKYHRQPAVVDFLLSRGPELSLHEAAAVGDEERVRAIVKQQGSPVIDSFARDGFTALGLAAYFGHPAIASFLVDQGANLDLAANNPMMVAPIHAAVAARQTAIVEMLVAAGADVNKRQQQGFTPLHAAAMNGDEGVVRLLLAHGADRGARSDNGQSALDFAMQHGHAGVAALLGQ